MASSTGGARGGMGSVKGAKPSHAAIPMGSGAEIASHSYILADFIFKTQIDAKSSPVASFGAVEIAFDRDTELFV